MAYDWALVATGGGKPPQAWNIYHTEIDAHRAVDPARKDNHGRPYASVMPMDEYRAARRAHFLAENPLKPCTRDEWMSALVECLPPLHWNREGGVERFCMSEFFTDTLTHQYARMGELYGTRLVDAHDRSTWITADEIRARFAQLREDA